MAESVGKTIWKTILHHVLAVSSGHAMVTYAIVMTGDYSLPTFSS